MGDVATLLYGVAALVGAIGSAVAVVINAARSSRRERPTAARQALGRLAKAAADGQISNEDVAAILGKLRAEIESTEDSAEYEDDNDNGDDDEDDDDSAAPQRFSGVLPHPIARAPRTPHRRRRRKSG